MSTVLISVAVSIPTTLAVTALMRLRRRPGPTAAEITEQGRIVGVAMRNAIRS